MTMLLKRSIDCRWVLKSQITIPLAALYSTLKFLVWPWLIFSIVQKGKRRHRRARNLGCSIPALPIAAKTSVPQDLLDVS